jgi:hypothetical protein
MLVTQLFPDGKYFTLSPSTYKDHETSNKICDLTSVYEKCMENNFRVLII